MLKIRRKRVGAVYKKRYIREKNPENAADTQLPFARGVQQKVHKRKGQQVDDHYPDFLLSVDEVNLYASILRSACFRIIAGNRLLGTGTGRIQTRTGNTAHS